MSGIPRPLGGRLLRQTHQLAFRNTDRCSVRQISAEACQASWRQDSATVDPDTQAGAPSSRLRVETLTNHRNTKRSGAKNILRLTPQDNVEDITLKTSRYLSAKGFTDRICNIDEIFDLIEDPSVRASVTRRVHTGLASNSVSIGDWIAWLNILQRCRDWDECVAEHYRVKSLYAGTSFSGIQVDIESWPASVLLHAVGLISTPAQARDAIELISQRSHKLSTVSQRRVLLELDEKVFQVLRAHHLGHLISPLHLDYADRLLSADGKVEAGSREYEAYSVLSTHLRQLSFRREDRTRALATQAIRWADLRLNQDLVDRLRMRLLGIVHGLKGDWPDTKAVMKQRTWQECHWTISSGRPLADSKMASQLLEALHRNDRHGVGFTLALRRAMQIAAYNPNLEDSRTLQELVRTYMQEEDRISDTALFGAEALQLLVKEGRDQEIWSIFRPLLKADDKSERRREWVVILGWLAAKKDIPPHHALALADVGEESIDGKVPLFHHSDICTALLVGLTSRADDESYECAFRLWREIVRCSVSIDATCLARICQAMIQGGEVDKAISLLKVATNEHNTSAARLSDGEARVVERVSPSSELFHLLMLTFMSRGDTRQVYELFKKLDAHGDLETDARSIELLLRAAYDISRYASDDDERHPIISAMFSRLTSRSREVRHPDVMLWDGEAAALKARDIFLDRLYAQHPEVKHLPLPIDSPLQSGNLLFRNELRMRNGSNWFSSAKHTTMPGESNGTDDERQEKQWPEAPQRIRYAFSGWTFHRYLLLLPYAEKAAARAGGHPKIPWEERLLVLSWMRALDVRPDRFTLCLLCIQLDEVLPPVADYITFKDGRNIHISQRDQWAAGPLNDYLAEWLGEDAVPTYNDVFKAMSSRNALAGGEGTRY